MSYSKTTITPRETVFFWFMVISLIFFLWLSYDHFVNAEEPKHIAIDFSDSCLAMFELDNFDSCGDPNVIMQAYPQAKVKPTFQKMLDDSAKLERVKYQKNNILQNHIKSCVTENYCNIFDNYSNVYYWYDPDYNIRGYYDKIITISPNLKHTNLNTQNQEIFDNGTSRTLILDTNQINIRSCHNIAYTPEPFRQIQEMGGLMWFILTDCTNENRLGVLKEPYTQQHTKHDLDITTSPNYQYLKQLEELKNKYKENRIGKD